MTLRYSVPTDSPEFVVFGSADELCRPCVECGLKTGNYCDGTAENLGMCLAAMRVPSESWASGQRTPLCTRCEDRVELCRFCRGVHGCTPPSS